MWAREPPDSAGAEPEEQVAPKERGRPLDAAMKGRAEQAFGRPLGDVRVHAGGDGARLAESVGARATARGTELSFANGEYAPGTLFGDALIAHELAHVAQQQGGTGAEHADGSRHEADADRAAAGVLGFGDAAAPREHGGPALQRCSRGGPTDAGVLPDAGPRADAGVDAGAAADPNADVARVRSLSLEGEIKHGSGTLNEIRRVWARRNKRIEERLALNPSTADAARLKSLQNRWSSMTALMAGEGLDPYSASLDDARVQELIQGDVADHNALSAKGNDTVKAEVMAFVEAVRKLLDTRRVVSEENVEFHRFDALFTDPEVLKLLDAGPVVRFSPAELKAVLAQESGDFTNTAVAGVEGKTRGIRDRRANPLVAGVAQMMEDARDEAITWANGRGVHIPAAPDPRLTPATAVKLAAAYLGRLQDLLRTVWPLYSANARDRKFLVLAAYNWKVGKVGALVRKHSDKRSGSVTWDQIVHGLPEETRDYVSRIEARLGR